MRRFVELFQTQYDVSLFKADALFLSIVPCDPVPGISNVKNQNEININPPWTMCFCFLVISVVDMIDVLIALRIAFSSGSNRIPTDLKSVKKKTLPCLYPAN